MRRKTYVAELQGCNSFNPSHTINLTVSANDSSPKMQKTILLLNFFSTRVISFCHLQNISNFSHRLSLLPLISVFQFSPKSFLSLTHIPSTPARLRSLSGGERLSSRRKNPNPGTLSFSHLTSLISPVL
jgi:hypothetical protein